MKRNYGLFYGIMLSSLLLFSSLGSTASAQILPLLQPPTNLAAHAVSTSQINLSWSQPENLGNLVLTGYKIERSVNGGPWSTIVSNTGSTGTTYSDTGLSPSTT
ncbi:MAG TPA: fibronectin type III domain-containing protein, partial [Candidatus Nitrosotalea sp.]|nr:fibronectin type III domain-containing protein [Candidatus Nitrosotalea sp.]